MPVTNESNIGLPLAVWLLHDEYDYVQGVENYVSVTTLMRPLKQIILPGRIPPEEQTIDVRDLVARKLGTAIHDSVERAWERGAHRALRKLGHPESVVKRLLVNPTSEQLKSIKDPIVVWLENRGYREVSVEVAPGKTVTFTVGGKFDMVSDGIVNDNKSTSAYSWVSGNRDDDHRLQMSLYRWIDAARTDGEKPRITEDFANVNYVFTDWQKAQARSNPNYPQERVQQKVLELTDEPDVDTWVRSKLTLIHKYRNSPESEMPECTDAELWRSDPKFKFFSDPAKATQPGARSTTNFDSLAEAAKHRADAGKGVVVTIPGEVKACGYCPAFDACQQKEQYLQ